MRECQTHFNLIQRFLHFLQTSRDLVKESTGASPALFDNAAIDLHVQANQFDVRCNARVDLSLIHLDCICILSSCCRCFRVIGLVVHRCQEKRRGVLSTLCLTHVLKYAYDPFSTLGEFKTKSLICLSLLALIEVIVTVGVSDAPHHTVSNPNEKERVEDQIIHYCTIRDISLVEPGDVIWSDKVQNWENRTID